MPPTPYEPWKSPRRTCELARLAKKTLCSARLVAMPKPVMKKLGMDVSPLPLMLMVERDRGAYEITKAAKGGVQTLIM